MECGYERHMQRTPLSSKDTKAVPELWNICWTFTYILADPILSVFLCYSNLESTLRSKGLTTNETSTRRQAEGSTWAGYI